MNWLLRLLRWLLELLGLINRDPLPPRVKLEMDMARATLTWTLPTQRVDGRPLDPTEIDRTEIRMSADGGANFSDPPVIVPPDAVQTFVADNLVAGDYVFRATVFDTDGRNSAPSDATGTVLGNPEPVSDLTVVIE